MVGETVLGKDNTVIQFTVLSLVLGPALLVKVGKGGLSNLYSEKDEIVKYIFGKDAVKLEKQFPGRLLLVRYEDLSLNTEETIRATEK